MSTFNIKGGEFKNSHFGDIQQQINTDQSMTIEKDARVGTATQNASTSSVMREAAIGEQLAVLRKLVDEIARRAPEKAQQVKHDFEQLEKQAKSPEPRKNWYDVSAEGLMNAAKSVFETVEPMAGALMAVAKILFGV
jgi:hypothetical protein